MQSTSPFIFENNQDILKASLHYDLVECLNDIRFFVSFIPKSRSQQLIEIADEIHEICLNVCK